MTHPVTPAEVEAIREKVESDVARAKREDMPIFAATTSHIDTLLRHIDDLTAELAVSNQRADAAAKAERDLWSAWCRSEATGPIISPIGPLHGVGFADGLNHAADAIARGDSEPNNHNNAATRQE